MLNFKNLNITESLTEPTETATTVISEISGENPEDILDALFSSIGPSFFIYLFLFIVLCIMLFSFSRSKKKRKNNGVREEIIGYIQPAEEHKYSGNVTFSNNKIYYARGNRKTGFDITIEKDTVLAPFMVDSWFENRNYNYREATIILSDISHYLKTNKLCKTTTITTDEEYQAMFSDDEDANLTEE